MFTDGLTDVKHFFSLMGFCVLNSIIHPCTELCPHLSPETTVSPIPWWGSIAIIVIGIATWIAGDVLKVSGITEAARAMVYVPLGNVFGMTFQINYELKKKAAEREKQDDFNAHIDSGSVR